MSQIKANADVVSANNTVTSQAGVDWSGVVAGNLFSLVGSAVPYYVGSTIAPFAGNSFKWQIVLTANYAGSTATNQPTIVTRDFTPILGLPLLNAGDTETVTLVNRMMAILDNMRVGTVAGGNAVAGSVGELIPGTLAVGSAVALTTATAATVLSISLTAGDWDVDGVLDLHPAGTTTLSLVQGGISIVAATLGAQDTFFTFPSAIPAGAADFAADTPTVRVNVTVTTTVYLVAKASFAVSTCGAYGTLRARRVR